MKKQIILSEKEYEKLLSDSKNWKEIEKLDFLDTTILQFNVNEALKVQRISLERKKSLDEKELKLEEQQRLVSRREIQVEHDEESLKTQIREFNKNVLEYEKSMSNYNGKMQNIITRENAIRDNWRTIHRFREERKTWSKFAKWLLNLKKYENI